MGAETMTIAYAPGHRRLGEVLTALPASSVRVRLDSGDVALYPASLIALEVSEA